MFVPATPLQPVEARDALPQASAATPRALKEGRSQLLDARFRTFRKHCPRCRPCQCRQQRRHVHWACQKCWAGARRARSAPTQCSEPAVRAPLRAASFSTSDGGSCSGAGVSPRCQPTHAQLAALKMFSCAPANARRQCQHRREWFARCTWTGTREAAGRQQATMRAETLLRNSATCASLQRHCRAARTAPTARIRLFAQVGHPNLARCLLPSTSLAGLLRACRAALCARCIYRVVAPRVTPGCVALQAERCGAPLQCGSRCGGMRRGMVRLV